MFNAKIEEKVVFTRTKGIYRVGLIKMVTDCDGRFNYKGIIHVDNKVIATKNFHAAIAVVTVEVWMESVIQADRDERDKNL